MKALRLKAKGILALEDIPEPEVSEGSQPITIDATYDIVFDTVGSIATKEQTIRSTKKGGKCIFLGFETPELTINMSEIIRHQKILQGSFVYSRSQFSQAIELAKLCDHRWVKNITFNEVAKILKEFAQDNFDKIKVALRPNA